MKEYEAERKRDGDKNVTRKVHLLVSKRQSLFGRGANAVDFGVIIRSYR